MLTLATNHIDEDVYNQGPNNQYGPCHVKHIKYGCGYNVMCYLGWYGQGSEGRGYCISAIREMENRGIGQGTSGLVLDSICDHNNLNLPNGSKSNYYPWSPHTPCAIYKNIMEQMNRESGNQKTNSYVIISSQLYHQYLQYELSNVHFHAV